jgi:general secretion pathway protein E
LQDHKQNFYAVTSDPFNADLLVWITKKIQAPLTQYLAIPSDILAYLSKQEESVRAVDQIIADDKQEDKLVSSTKLFPFASVNASNSPAVKLVSSTLYDALKTGASDIHLECTPQSCLLNIG